MKEPTECEHCHESLDNTKMPKTGMTGAIGGYQIVFVHKRCEAAWDNEHAGR